MFFSVKSDSDQNPPFRKKVVAFLAAVSLPVIALGTFSEAVMLVEQASDRVVSSFTHFPEYKDLSLMRVGISRDYAGKVFGVPQVHRELGSGLSAEYYFNSKYLLTMLIRGNEVAGYTVTSLRDGFAPPVFDHEAGGLGEFPLADVPGEPGDFLVDWTKTSAVYLEEVNLGGSSLNQSALLGWLNYGASAVNEGLAELYRSALTGEGSTERRQTVRALTHANLYGWGRVTLTEVQASLLSPAELGHYLSAYHN